MTDKSGHSDPTRSDLSKILERFPSDDRSRARKLWDLYIRALPDLPHVTENDVENALSEVHERIGVDGGFLNSDSESSGNSLTWQWILAAAILLLVFGAGLIMIPQTVNAPYGETTNFTLADGSTIELNSGSQIQYNRLYNYTNRTVHLNGEAYFSIREGRDPFIINANNSTVEVTGTRFNVRSWSDDPGKETEVTVTEGSVLFYPHENTEHSVKLIPGQWSRWTIHMQEPTQPEPVNIERVLGWRDNSLMFNDKSLSVIFSELERRFDVNIRLEDMAVGRETLTTYYAKPGDVESVIEDVCRVKGLRYAKTANGFRIYR